MTETHDYGPRIASLERQMDGLKAEVSGVKEDLVVMEKTAAEHRTKEEAMLTRISDKVEAISREQILESGRRQGEEKTRGQVGVWTRFAGPIVVSAGTAFLVLFIKSQTPPPAPPTIIVSPPPPVEVTPSTDKDARK